MTKTSKPFAGPFPRKSAGSGGTPSPAAAVLERPLVARKQGRTATVRPASICRFPGLLANQNSQPIGGTAL